MILCFARIVYSLFMQLHQLYKTKNIYFELEKIFLEKFQTNDYQKHTSNNLKNYRKSSCLFLKMKL